MPSARRTPTAPACEEPNSSVVHDSRPPMHPPAALPLPDCARTGHRRRRCRSPTHPTTAFTKEVTYTSALHDPARRTALRPVPDRKSGPRSSRPDASSNPPSRSQSDLHHHAHFGPNSHQTRASTRGLSVTAAKAHTRIFTTTAESRSNRDRDPDRPNPVHIRSISGPRAVIRIMAPSRPSPASSGNGPPRPRTDPP